MVSATHRNYEDYKEELQEAGEKLNEVVTEDREVFIDKSQMSIFELHRRYERGDINLTPFYQRKDVWNRVKKSRLLESVMRSIPIPAIYLAEIEEGKWEVIDGQQRLRSFFTFLEGRYKLTRLPVLNLLNDKSFVQLDSSLQRKIEDYQLYLFIIKKESHPEIKFDIYLRINGGAVALNPQELRNCIYRGRGMDLVHNLARNTLYRELLGDKIGHRRCKDEEVVLRGLAYMVISYKSYQGNLNAFLNKALKALNEISDLKELEERFIDGLKLCSETLGKACFIKEDSKKISIPLYEVLLFSFSIIAAKPVFNEENLTKAILKLYNEEEFIKSITENTLTAAALKYRFSAVEKLLKEEGLILDDYRI